jgi:hypothetical protein
LANSTNKYGSGTSSSTATYPSIASVAIKDDSSIKGGEVVSASDPTSTTITVTVTYTFTSVASYLVPPMFNVPQTWTLVRSCTMNICQDTPN